MNCTNLSQKNIGRARAGRRKLGAISRLVPSVKQLDSPTGGCSADMLMLMRFREGGKVLYRNIVSEVFDCHRSFAIVPGIHAEKIGEACIKRRIIRDLQNGDLVIRCPGSPSLFAPLNGLPHSFGYFGMNATKTKTPIEDNHAAAAFIDNGKKLKVQDVAQRFGLFAGSVKAGRLGNNSRG
jgi:hypothetical protein